MTSSISLTLVPAVLLVLAARPVATGQQDPETSDLPAHHEAIAPYVAFLEEHQQGAVDYVLSLFDRFDLVILCERSHPETSQYDLFFDVVRDERFTRRVGHVFTEVGTSAVRPAVEAYLMGSSYADGSAAARSEVVFDATGTTPRILFWRDISHLGRGYAVETLGVNMLDSSL